MVRCLPAFPALGSSPQCPFAARRGGGQLEAIIDRGIRQATWLASGMQRRASADLSHEFHQMLLRQHWGGNGRGVLYQVPSRNFGAGRLLPLRQIITHQACSDRCVRCMKGTVITPECGCQTELSRRLVACCRARTASATGASAQSTSCLCTRAWASVAIAIPSGIHGCSQNLTIQILRLITQRSTVRPCRVRHWHARPRP